MRFLDRKETRGVECVQQWCSQATDELKLNARLRSAFLLSHPPERRKSWQSSGSTHQSGPLSGSAQAFALWGSFFPFRFLSLSFSFSFLFGCDLKKRKKRKNIIKNLFYQSGFWDFISSDSLVCRFADFAIIILLGWKSANLHLYEK